MIDRPEHKAGDRMPRRRFGQSPAILVALSALLLAAAPAPPQPPRTLQLWRLRCGPDLPWDLTIFSDTFRHESGKRTLVFSCYLIRHGDDYMIWDTGLPGAPGSRIVDQLRQLGVAPNRIRFVGISHDHNDHIGQAADFPRATLVIGREDIDDVRKGGVLSDNSTDASVRLAPWVSGGAKVIPVAHDLDVFGDGSVVMLATPGHTPGHHSLLVRLPKTGNVLLTGDLYHFAENREAKLVPIFNTNRADTLASMDRFETIARNLNAKVVIQHEQADVGKLPTFPAPAD